jgi:hypothetical protein
MNGASRSRAQLIGSLGEAEELVARGGDEPLHKAGVVMLCAAFEAFCEALCAEALDALIEHTADPARLPRALKRQIAVGLREDRHELAVWALAGDGWKRAARGHLAARQPNGHVAADAVDALFEHGLGLPTVSDRWRARSLKPEVLRRKLREALVLREAIVRRGRLPKRVTAKETRALADLVWKLGALTDHAVNEHVRKSVGKPLYEVAAQNRQLDLFQRRKR